MEINQLSRSGTSPEFGVELALVWHTCNWKTNESHTPCAILEYGMIQDNGIGHLDDILLKYFNENNQQKRNCV